MQPQHDLDTFHTLHFHPSAQAFPSPNPDQQKTSEEQVYDAALDVDDGLGYHDDGVKRTLTDEQIAMFRHSEIQQLLKERRRRRAEQEEEQEAQGEAARQDDTSEALVGNSDAPATAQETGALRQLSSEIVDGGGDMQLPKRKKRKQDRKAEKHEAVEEQKTSRRLARELDEVQATNVELDY